MVLLISISVAGVATLISSIGVITTILNPHILWIYQYFSWKRQPNNFY